MFVSCFRCKITIVRNSQQENLKIKKTILITTKMAVFLFQRASNRELFGVSVSETVAPSGRTIFLFCYAKSGALEGGAPFCDSKIKEGSSHWPMDNGIGPKARSFRY